MGYVRKCPGKGLALVVRRERTGGDGMADSYSSKLQIWEGWATSRFETPAPPADGRLLVSPRPGTDWAERLFAGEALAGGDNRRREGAQPFTLQWFLDIENVRFGRQGSWIPRLLEFSKHGGETLLGLGHSLGTDWVQYARNGADVVACSPSAEQLALVQRNFEMRGLTGVFVHANPTALPLEPASIDVVCVTGLLQATADPAAVVAEIYRVLKPGGKVLALAPARYDVDFWCRCCLPWQHWFGRRRKAERAGQTFGARALRRLFGRFVEPKVYKRHLRRGDVPHLWRWTPHPLLERLMGRLLVFKGFKPLSAAMTVHAAA
jgi:SAM-dependent methyltransferase